MSAELDEVTELLQPFIRAYLHKLAETYGHTPLEAGAHLETILQAALEDKRKQHSSLLDTARGCLPLLRDLESSLAHTVVAGRWGTSEGAVRRARNKLRVQDVTPVTT